MSECSSIIWRRLRYMLTPQFELYRRIGERFSGENLDPGSSILDYGCGTGFGTLQLCSNNALSSHETGDFMIPNRIYGVDEDQDAVNFARDAFGLIAEFVQANAFPIVDSALLAWTDLKERAAPFSLVTVIEVVEHMPKRYQEDLVRELASVIDPRGLMVISTPNKRSQWRKHSGHVGIHDPASLRALLSPHFSSVTFEDYLGEPLADDSVVSPLVAICREPK